jgi:hypothetical protein
MLTARQCQLPQKLDRLVTDLSAAIIQYEMARALKDSTVAAWARCVNGAAVGLVADLDRSLELLGHLPYHESDHVLKIFTTLWRAGSAWKILVRRQDESYLNGLGANGFGPTTAGDFTRPLASRTLRRCRNA